MKEGLALFASSRRSGQQVVNAPLSSTPTRISLAPIARSPRPLLVIIDHGFDSPSMAQAREYSQSLVAVMTGGPTACGRMRSCAPRRLGEARHD